MAASILTAAWHRLKIGTLYHDLGPDHFQRRPKAAEIQHLVRRLQNFGYAAEVPRPATA